MSSVIILVTTSANLLSDFNLILNEYEYQIDFKDLDSLVIEKNIAGIVTRIYIQSVIDFSIDNGFEDENKEVYTRLLDSVKLFPFSVSYGSKSFLKEVFNLILNRGDILVDISSEFNSSDIYKGVDFLSDFDRLLNDW